MLYRVLKSITFVSILMLASCEQSLQHEYAYKTIMYDSIPKFMFFDNIDGELIPADENRIELYAPVDLIENIWIDTLDQSLQFKNHNTNNWKYYQDSIKATVYYKQPIKQLRLHGTGDFNLQWFKQDARFDLLVFGGSGTINANFDLNTFRLISYTHATTDIHLHGNCLNFYAYINGTGRIHALDMRATYTKFQHNSTNNHYINVIDKLDAEFLNIGELFVQGSPVITISDNSDSNKINSLNN